MWVPAPLTFAISASKIVNITRTALTTAGELSRAKCRISAPVKNFETNQELIESPAPRQFTFSPLVRAPATIFKSANFRWKTRLQLDFHKRSMSGASSFHLDSFWAGRDAVVGEKGLFCVLNFTSWSHRLQDYPFFLAHLLNFNYRF